MMMKRKILYIFIALIFLISIGVISCFGKVVKTMPEKNEKKGITKMLLAREEKEKNFFLIGKNRFRKSETGLWELYIEGSPFERGLIAGMLTKEHVALQEEYFVQEIKKYFYSPAYMYVVGLFVLWFNRNIDQFILPEYLDEIYGISNSATEKFKMFGSPYQRIMNYHAAHDIGHMVQNMHLVGCTSFAAWGEKSENNSLLVGRNFDFYAGENFSENKIVMFVNPEKGHRFASITWGGMIGVVSGMNDQGLAITINAAPSTIPASAATPVSIIVREALQYAENIEEAAAIIKKRQSFVSETFLVASKKDGIAVIIEKTPEKTEIYTVDKTASLIAGTNHFQSNGLKNTDENKTTIKNDPTLYRLQRAQELIAKTGKLNPLNIAEILRDYRGKNNTDIGFTNEVALNQFVSHHSVIFNLDKGIMWVSTSPWQLGKYAAYDLAKVFSTFPDSTENREIRSEELDIPESPILKTPEIKNVFRFFELKKEIAKIKEVGGKPMPEIVAEIAAVNPNFYLSYSLPGDAFKNGKDCASAAKLYEKALTFQIPYKNDEANIRKNLKECSGENQ